MKFVDSEIEQLNLRDPADLSKLIIDYLCGKSASEITDTELDLVRNLLDGLNDDDIIKYNQLNEILLVLNRDTMSNDFFNYFFIKNGLTLNELKQKIIDFRGYALLCFGNFRFAYKELSKKRIDEIENLLLPYCYKSCKLIKEYEERPNIMLNIDEIPREKTWLTGYLSAKKIEEDVDTIRLELEDASKSEDVPRIERLVKLSRYIESLRDDLIKYKKIAIKNTDIYLTWDYIDVYVATSMRNRWEFKEIYDFVKNVFTRKEFEELKIRFFNPTQSTCISPKDKGLVEGLMLKRSKCTIYLAQENDTMGKDSELATTLAQGKPVIAYVPDIDVNTYFKKILQYPLDFFKKRILILIASELFDDPEVKDLLQEKYPKYLQIRDDFLDKIEEYEKKQIFLLGTERDEQDVKDDYVEFETLCKILAEVERIYFNKRARTLQEAHPLSMQLNLKTGVANGVLVVRTPEQCAELLYKVLTNDISFHIEREKFSTYGIDDEIWATFLIEDTSQSPFRIVTDYEKLTNSFWNLFHENP